MSNLKFLLREIITPNPVFEVEPYENWYALESMDGINSCISCTKRPGFDSEDASITFMIYEISPTFIKRVEIEPMTMAEAALNWIINIKLKGPGVDPSTIYWDSKGNSFAIVKPKNQNKRFVSNQGVMLVSINGIGEVLSFETEY